MIAKPESGLQAGALEIPVRLRGKARQLGLECSPEKIRRSGLMSSGNPRCVASRFKKGNIPANKGKRMSPEVYAKAARTMFKKGNTPHNHREVGSERVNVDGSIKENTFG